MRAGELRERVDVFRHSDVGTDGYESPRYTRSPLGRGWYAKKVIKSAVEQQAGGSMQQVIRATFVFRISAEEALTSDGLLRHRTEWWSPTGIRRHYDDERYDRGGISVDCVRATDEPEPEDLVE